MSYSKIVNSAIVATTLSQTLILPCSFHTIMIKIFKVTLYMYVLIYYSCNFNQTIPLTNPTQVMSRFHYIPYSGKIWRGESSANLANRPWFAKLKPFNLVLTIGNILADLLIRQTFFRQMLEKSELAKLSPRQTFPLYGNHNCDDENVINFTGYFNVSSFCIWIFLWLCSVYLS